MPQQEAPNAVDRGILLRFLGKLGQAELNAGNAVPLVERDLAMIAKANGETNVQVFVLPTVLFLKWESGDEHRVDMAHGAYRVPTLRFDQIEEVLTIARGARRGDHSARRTGSSWRPCGAPRTTTAMSDSWPVT